MAAPVLANTYPSNNDIGIPTGISLKLWFSRSVSLQSVLDSVILHGQDFDTKTGPESAQWITQGISNPFFLTSPGFKGVAPVNITLDYYDLESEELVDTVFYNQEDEVSADVGHLATITLDPEYNSVLSPNTVYTFHIVGDPEDQDLGICSRTVWPAEEVAITGDGFLDVDGLYTGLSDVVHVKVTKAGNINVAKFKFWLESEGENSAQIGRVCSTKYRTLDYGLRVKFRGDGFDIGDHWKFAVEAPERMVATTKVVFTTNDGSYLTAPASPSTPASSEVPSSISPDYVDDADTLSITKMVPADGSYNVRTNVIVITFNKPPDPSSITTETLKLWDVPIEGLHEYSGEVIPLKYSYTLSGSTLTIRI